MTTHTGVLVETPYPTLLTQNPDGTLRPMLLVGYGKTALARSGAAPAWVEITASVIQRGPHAMLAVVDAQGFPALSRAIAPFLPPTAQDLGPAVLIGEIVDAKCWFGAMNPGVGLTHKACAALCARGRLPLAFQAEPGCTDGEEPHLFLDADGRPHTRAMHGLLAAPVVVAGQLVRRNGLLELRAAPESLQRL